VSFKADASFLEKLTMGAIATRAAMSHLRDLGLRPIELERYCTSNKIWATKVKRLRLADLICTVTGLRIEVRGKSDLKIRMSDSPSNPDRRWDTGLRDDDLVALVSCTRPPVFEVRGSPAFFAIGDLRASVDSARLGPPKSPSEGAERDLTWPAIVPSQDGQVLEVAGDRLRVRMTSGRNQTYNTRGKHLYVSPGTHFIGEASILAGTVPKMADPAAFLTRSWEPERDLESQIPSDRYAAAKAISRRATESRGDGAALLDRALSRETEPRAALEIAGALALLGGGRGYAYLEDTILRASDSQPDYLPMEAVLILSEMPTEESADLLDRVASSSAFEGDEIRQAAVWGLGRSGVHDYERLARYVGDEERDVALHAIVGFGADVSIPVIRGLVDLLMDPSMRRVCPAASAALLRIGSVEVATELIRRLDGASNPWLLATLGRLDPSLLGGVELPDAIARAIQPVAVLAEGENWLASPAVAADLNFLLGQYL